MKLIILHPTPPVLSLPESEWQQGRQMKVVGVGRGMSGRNQYKSIESRYPQEGPGSDYKSRLNIFSWLSFARVRRKIFQLSLNLISVILCGTTIYPVSQARNLPLTPHIKYVWHACQFQIVSISQSVVSPWTNDINIHWKLVSNTNYWVSPQTH